MPTVQTTRPLSIIKRLLSGRYITSDHCDDSLAEFRFFIRDRQVVAWSPYWLRGELARRGDEWVVETEFATITRELLDRLLFDQTVTLPRAVVIDAGLIEGRGPAVVEANQASGAGIYGCDPRDVLEALRAAVVFADR